MSVMYSLGHNTSWSLMTTTTVPLIMKKRIRYTLIPTPLAFIMFNGKGGRERECVSFILIRTFKVGGMRQGGGEDLIPLSDNFCIIAMYSSLLSSPPFLRGQLSPSRRLQALRRLSSLLSKRPDPDTLNLPTSLSLLPQTLADLLRANNGVGERKREGEGGRKKGRGGGRGKQWFIDCFFTVNQTPTSKATSSLEKNVLIKLSHDSLVQSLVSDHTHMTTPSIL